MKSNTTVFVCNIQIRENLKFFICTYETTCRSKYNSMVSLQLNFDYQLQHINTLYMAKTTKKKKTYYKCCKRSLYHGFCFLWKGGSNKNPFSNQDHLSNQIIYFLLFLWTHFLAHQPYTTRLHLHCQDSWNGMKNHHCPLRLRLFNFQNTNHSRPLISECSRCIWTVFYFAFDHWSVQFNW